VLDESRLLLELELLLLLLLLLLELLCLRLDLAIVCVCGCRVGCKWIWLVGRGGRLRCEVRIELVEEAGKLASRGPDAGTVHISLMEGPNGREHPGTQGWARGRPVVMDWLGYIEGARGCVCMEASASV
jgi:hypothetical protein